MASASVTAEIPNNVPASGQGHTKEEDKQKEPVGQNAWIQELQADRKSLFVKVGPPYQGVYFTIDPVVVQFEESDSFNQLLTGRRVDTELLRQVLLRCPNIENLKFFGVKIPRALVKVIAENCPKLINLELNHHEKEFDFEPKDVSCLPEIKALLANCPELKVLIIREPSEGIRKFLGDSGYGYDKVDRNFFFDSPKCEIDYQTAYHNVNVPGFGGNGMFVGVRCFPRH